MPVVMSERGENRLPSNVRLYAGQSSDDTVGCDLKHDEADVKKKIACPLLALWGERSPMGRLYDVLAVWRDRGVKVSGKACPAATIYRKKSPSGIRCSRS